MTDQKFKTGDVVKLKSGGPIMTVTNVAGTDAVNCVWFDNNNKESSGKYPEAALEIFKADILGC